MRARLSTWGGRLAVLAAFALAGALAPLAVATLHAQPQGGASFTPRDESPEDYPAGEWRDETFYACTPCHGFRIVAAQGLSRAQWEDSVDLMIEKHRMPPLDAEDRKRVLDYLTETFPPRRARPGGWQSPVRRPSGG